MRPLLHLSRLDALWNLSRGEVFAFVLVAPLDLQLDQGTIWLTRKGQDEILNAPVRLSLEAGRRVVMEAMTDSSRLRLSPSSAIAGVPGNLRNIAVPHSEVIY